MGKITVTGVTIEIIGVVALVVAMFIKAERSPAAAIANTGEHGQGLGYFPAFLASMLMACYVMTGVPVRGLTFASAEPKGRRLSRAIENITREADA